MLNKKKILMLMMNIYFFNVYSMDKNNKDYESNFNQRIKKICVNNSLYITLGTMFAAGTAGVLSRGKLSASRFNIWNFFGKNKKY